VLTQAYTQLYTYRSPVSPPTVHTNQQRIKLLIGLGPIIPVIYLRALYYRIGEEGTLN